MAFTVMIGRVHWNGTLESRAHSRLESAMVVVVFMCNSSGENEMSRDFCVFEFIVVS